MSARIPLKRKDGSVKAWAVVDDADLEEMSRSAWQLGSEGYVVRSRGRRSHPREARMSRTLLGLALGDPREVDHIDRDRLNNQRANLRVVSRAANCQNVGSQEGSTSTYRGVTRYRRYGKWQAYAKLNGKLHHLGYFDDEHEAGAVAAAWRREHMPYSAEAMAG